MNSVPKVFHTPVFIGVPITQLYLSWNSITSLKSFVKSKYFYWELCTRPFMCTTVLLMITSEVGLILGF